MPGLTVLFKIHDQIWPNRSHYSKYFHCFFIYFENLYLSGGATNGGGTSAQADGYTWVGPYVQFKKGSAGMRFSFGSNVADESARFAPNDFYKLAFFFGI